MVLSIAAETTMPRRSLRCPRACSGFGSRTSGLRFAGRSRFGFGRCRRWERGSRLRFGFGSPAGGAGGASAAGASRGGPSAGAPSASVSGSSAGVASTCSCVSSSFLLGLAIYPLSSECSRSAWIVKIRAISRFASARRAVLSSAPVAIWKRRLKRFSRLPASRFTSSSSDRSLSSLALKEIRLPLYELRLHRQLHAREAQGVLGERLGHAGQLEHDPAGLDDGDPVLGRALARTHAGHVRA